MNAKFDRECAPISIQVQDLHTSRIVMFTFLYIQSVADPGLY